VRNRYWYWRRRKRDKTVSLDEPSSNAGAVSLRETLTTGDPNAATLSEQDDLFKQLEHSMERLPERDRKMLLLRDRHHASYGEIARSLVIPLGTVKSRIAHARVHLREIVRKGISADINLSSRGGRIQGATP
jgi:RNA polymerase sigma-70 factor (ECF subfamily)